MNARISSKADISSVFYRGRALPSAIADILAMGNDAWRARLREALAHQGKSKRSVSLQSGNGAGYIHSILEEGKDPTIQNLAAVCDALGISLTYLLYGFDVTPEDEEILSQMHQSPEKRAAVLTLLGARRST